MAIKCCYGCVPPKRHKACWGHCPDYAKEKAIDEEKKAAENKRKAIASGITAQKSDGVYRAYRKNKPKRSGWKRKN